MGSIDLSAGGGGITQETFDAHTHSYRKITQLGVDATKGYSSPAKVDIVDDSEVNTNDNQDTEAVGITVSTQPTSTPN